MSQPPVPMPLPNPTPTTQAFFDAARDGKLLLPKAEDGSLYFYPRPFAPGTLSPFASWVEASGKGAVYSFTVDRRGTASAFREQAPYVIAIIELDEGPRMTSNVIGCAPEDVYVGMPVEAVFEAQDDGILVKFRPAIK